MLLVRFSGSKTKHLFLFFFAVPYGLHYILMYSHNSVWNFVGETLLALKSMAELTLISMGSGFHSQVSLRTIT